MLLFWRLLVRGGQYSCLVHIVWSCLVHVTLNTVIQSRKEFQRPIWIAFVDLKAAFDSVDRKALWKLLRSLGLHSKVVDLIEALYVM